MRLPPPCRRTSAKKPASWSNRYGTVREVQSRVEAIGFRPDRRRFLDDVIGTAFHFVVDAAKVFAENADADKLHPTEKEHDGYKRGVAGRSCFYIQNPAYRVKHGGGESEYRNDHARVGQGAERKV